MGDGGPRGGCLAGREINDLDRPIERHTGRYVDECPVGNERRIERRERALLPTRVTCQVLSHDVDARPRTEDASETAGTSARGQGRRRGQLCLIASVDEDHARTEAERKALDVGGGRKRGARTVRERER